MKLTLLNKFSFGIEKLYTNEADSKIKNLSSELQLKAHQADILTQTNTNLTSQFDQQSQENNYLKDQLKRFVI